MVNISDLGSFLVNVTCWMEGFFLQHCVGFMMYLMHEFFQLFYIKSYGVQNMEYQIDEKTYQKHLRFSPVSALSPLV